jgi:murein DD-endopeptidase MepM/ murein hydrolase activator NlpD
MKLRKVLSLILVFVLILTALPAPIPVMAASSKEIQNQINQLKKEKEEIGKKLEEIQLQKEETRDEIQDIVNKKNIIDQELQLLSEQIDNINQQIMQYNMLIADTQDELTVLQEEYEELRQKSKQRVRAMEENGSISYWSVIFKASNFSDLLSRMTMVEEIANADQRMLESLSDSAEKVEVTKMQLAEEKSEFDSAREELETAEAAQAAKRAEAEAIIQELLTKVKDLDALEMELEQQEQDFLEEIAQKEDELEDAKYQEWLDYIASLAPPVTDNTPDIKEEVQHTNSNWIKPCYYSMLTSPFGYRTAPTTGASTYHQGVDLALSTGTPIYASRAGVVTFAGYSGAGGNWVKINHMDGYGSVYLHLDSISVSYGQTVHQGQQIGRGGSTGVSTGPHLHFGIIYNGTYVNPAQYIAF